MKKTILLCFCLSFFYLNVPVSNAQIGAAIKCFRKFGKATPWELIQAVDSLFEQNPELRVPCEFFEIFDKNTCLNTSDCQERQCCYFQLERERSLYYPEWLKKPRIPPIGTSHYFRLSSNSDTLIRLDICNSLRHNNKYADCCLTGCTFLNKEIPKRYDLTRKQERERDQILAKRFEEEFIRRLEKILIENRKKQQ